VIEDWFLRQNRALRRLSFAFSFPRFAKYRSIGIPANTYESDYIRSLKI
jgi:hypothetical protein